MNFDVLAEPSQHEVEDKNEELVTQYIVANWDDCLDDLTARLSIETRQKLFDAWKESDKAWFCDLLMDELHRYAETSPDVQERLDDWIRYGWAQEMDEERRLDDRNRARDMNDEFTWRIV